MNSLENITNFLDKLNERKIRFSLEYNRSGYIMVCIAVPGERWEVEFSTNGDIEVEIFMSNESSAGLESKQAIDKLFKEFSD